MYLFGNSLPHFGMSIPHQRKQRDNIWGLCMLVLVFITEESIFPGTFSSTSFFRAKHTVVPHSNKRVKAKSVQVPRDLLVASTLTVAQFLLTFMLLKNHRVMSLVWSAKPICA